MSRACGLRGGSCGNDKAGASPESTRTFSSSAICDVEKISASLGSDQIYRKWRERAVKTYRQTCRTSRTPCGRQSSSHCVFVPAFITVCNVDVTFLSAVALTLELKISVVSEKKHPAMYFEV
jgi:hypothetical protein